MQVISNSFYAYNMARKATSNICSLNDAASPVIAGVRSHFTDIQAYIGYTHLLDSLNP